MSTVVPQSEVLTDTGLAELLQVSTKTIQRAAKSPGFPKAFYIGRCRRWAKDTVLDFLKQHATAEAGRQLGAAAEK